MGRVATALGSLLGGHLCHCGEDSGQGGLGTGSQALTCDIPAGAQVQLQPGGLKAGFSRPGVAGGAERCPFGCPHSVLPQRIHLVPPGRGVEGGHLQCIAAGWRWETAD